MYEKTITVKNRAGVHGRPAALIVQTAYKFQSHIIFEFNGNIINVKSIMALITSGMTFGQPLLIRADGIDEIDAVNEMAKLFDNYFQDISNDKSI